MRVSMPTRKKRPAPPAATTWVRNARLITETAWAAPCVIAVRTARMAAAGWSPNARDRREFLRMGQEKVDAMIEGSMDAGAHLMQNPMSWAAGGWWEAWHQVIEKSLLPIHRRATANAKRLGRLPKLQK